MAKKSSHRQTDEERAERRRQDRERLQQVARELLSSDGWARWVKTRAMFHNYSASNCALLAWQCHERGIAPTRIAGFHTWLKLGRCVRKGEVALRILAPVSVKERDRVTGEETDERRVFFKTAFVFDVSQTEIREGAELVELEPPHQPLTGDSHAHLLTPMVAFAESLGYSVSFETIEGSAAGWCDPVRKRIVVDADAPANAQLRTLIHECAHAFGGRLSALFASADRADGRHGHSGCCVCGALEAVSEFAETIDRVARRIENVLLGGAHSAVEEGALAA